MTPADLSVLSAARARIADPNDWTQGAFARDMAGLPIDESDLRDQSPGEVLSCCADGALELEMHRLADETGKGASLAVIRGHLARVAQRLYPAFTRKGSGIPRLVLTSFNDFRAMGGPARLDHHKRVLDVFDTAIREGETT